MSTADEEHLARALRQEDPAVARDMALSVMAVAIEKGNIHLEGRARALLAECFILLADYRSAHEHSIRAIQLLQSVRDTSGESKALSVLSSAASALGSNDQAIEAALLGLELARIEGSADRRSELQVQLGLALLHARCFDASKDALQQARVLEPASSTALNALCSLVVEGTCEVVRVITIRHETGGMPPLDGLHLAMRRYDDFAARHDMVALAQPDQRPIQVNWNLVASAAHCWSGELSRAERELETVRRWMDEEGIAAWMESLEALVRCELAMARSDWPAAERAASRMVSLAESTGREQSALLGHVLACHVFERQGKWESAARELKQLAARERRIRASTLASRSAVVAWQLDMRRSEDTKRELQASAAQLERLTLEDPLTGIANRRCFEQSAEQSLRESLSAGRSLCVALIDVDRFKQVNDRFGHLVGDKVLQVVAALLVEQVRADDLAARWAGDEFVILFRRTELSQARDICSRLRVAIAGHDWGGIESTLEVTISVGVAESQPGDTLKRLVDRSDQAMYEHKTATKPGSR